MRAVARLSVVLFTLVATQLVQCGEDDGATAALCDAELPRPDEVIYPDDTASDEAVERVMDKYCEAQPLPGAATLTAPAAGSEIAAADLELAWEQTIALAPTPGMQEPAGSSGFPRLSFGVRTAAAHLPPVTGWVYLVEVRPEAREPLWIFTIERSWRPDPIAIYRMGAGKITVRITSAYLNTNVVEEGPWQGEERTFTVAGG